MTREWGLEVPLTPGALSGHQQALNRTQNAFSLGREGGQAFLAKGSRISPACLAGSGGWEAWEVWVG